MADHSRMLPANATGVLGGSDDLPIIKAPPNCEGKSEKQCDEEGTAWVLGTACTMAATAFGAPELAPVCGVLADAISKYAAPIFKWTGTAMQDIVMAVIPSSLTAQGVFSPNIAALELWIANPNCFDPSCAKDPPIIAVWKAAIQAVQVSWDEGRKAAGLPPSAVRIRPDILFPGSGKDDTILPPPAFVEGAEECLYWWLYRCPNGWGTEKVIWAFGKTDGGVALTVQYGKVEDMTSLVEGGDPNVWIGKGPFGLKTWGWPTKCSDFCHRSFHDHVIPLWEYRLEALSKAVPAVTGAAILQIAADKGGPKLSMKLARNAQMRAELEQNKWSTTTKVVIGGLTLGALGGLGYWLRQTKKWPFTKKWMPFKK